ncbi:MAG TPA: site-2 protease family protein [Acidimicrobiales bacterium]|nr:site-2 protease family protein [Acidimicrobiales bacterium]
MPTRLELDLAQFGILIASIILHEVSHGWAALGLGDDTAKRSGRLTLNPIAHIDPIGSVVLPAFLILTHAGFLFGWAKPVPVNVSRLRHPRNDAVLTGLAGPAMNLVLVGIALGLVRLLHPTSFWPWYLLFLLGMLNILLAFFNLIPVPPLDGSSVVERLLPRRWWGPYLAIRPYTLFIVLGLVIVLQRTGAWNTAYGTLESHWLSAIGYLPNAF